MTNVLKMYITFNNQFSCFENMKHKIKIKFLVIKNLNILNYWYLNYN